MGLVGPASSFMFRSTAWIFDGAGLLVLGLLLVAAGLLMGRRRA